jgi:hypothetical protein
MTLASRRQEDPSQKEVHMNKVLKAVLTAAAVVAGLLVALKPRKPMPPPRHRLHVPFL